jgi:hypothetical protein
LEKIPAETLTKPVEKTPSTQPLEAQRLFPTSLSDIEEAFSRITGAMRPPSSETVPPDRNSPKKPAAEQQH